MISNFAGSMMSRGGTGASTGFSGMAGLMQSASSQSHGLSLQQPVRSRAAPQGNNLAEQMPAMVVSAQLQKNQRRSRSVFV